MILDRIRRWWHCLVGMFGGHCMLTIRTRRGVTIMCTCGRVFGEDNRKFPWTI